MPGGDSSGGAPAIASADPSAGVQVNIPPMRSDVNPDMILGMRSNGSRRRSCTFAPDADVIGRAPASSGGDQQPPRAKAVPADRRRSLLKRESDEDDLACVDVSRAGTKSSAEASAKTAEAKAAAIVNREKEQARHQRKVMRYQQQLRRRARNERLLFRLFGWTRSFRRPRDQAAQC